MEPTTTSATSLIMPSPTQLVVGGLFLGIGLTAGYYLASMTADAVDAGLEKTGIKDRVERLMSSKKKKKHAEEDVEAEIDELENSEEDENEEVDDEDEDEDEDEGDEDGDGDGEADDELEEEEQVAAVKQSAKKAREKASA